MGKILVTGFGPFENVENNPSQTLAVESGRHHHVVEVSYSAAKKFIEELDAGTFDSLVMLGAHGTAKNLQLEMVARNQVQARPDVRGFIPQRGQIRPGHPEAIKGTLWPRLDLKSFIGDHGAAVSMDAGGYLCNFIYYEALCRFPYKQIGFLHVPLVTAMPVQQQQSKLLTLLEHVDVATASARQ